MLFVDEQASFIQAVYCHWVMDIFGRRLHTCYYHHGNQTFLNSLRLDLELSTK